MTATDRAGEERRARIRAAALRAVRMAECREPGCAKPIRFVQLESGRKIPVDPREHTGGNVAASLSGNQLVGFVITPDHRPGPLTPYRFLPHFASCEARKQRANNPPTTPDDPALF